MSNEIIIVLVLGFLAMGILFTAIVYDDPANKLERGMKWCDGESTLEAYMPDDYDFLKCPIIMTKTTCTVESIETKTYQESIDKVVVGNYTTIYANGDEMIINEIYDLDVDIVNSIIVYDKQKMIFSTEVEELYSEDDFEWYHGDSTFSERMYEFDIIENGEIIINKLWDHQHPCEYFDNEVVILKEIRS